MEQIFLNFMLYASVFFTLFFISGYTFFFVSQLIKELWGMTWIERKIFIKEFIYIMGETFVFLMILSSPFLFLVWGLA